MLYIVHFSGLFVAVPIWSGFSCLSEVLLLLSWLLLLSASSPSTQEEGVVWHVKSQWRNNYQAHFLGTFIIFSRILWSGCSYSSTTTFIHFILLSFFIHFVLVATFIHVCKSLKTVWILLLYQYWHICCLTCTDI